MDALGWSFRDQIGQGSVWRGSSEWAAVKTENWKA